MEKRFTRNDHQNITTQIKIWVLDICGKIGFYPKKTRFRSSTRYAKETFGGKQIVVAEIGTDRGENALNILKNLNVKKIYLIDPYMEYKDYKDSEPHRTKKVLGSAYRNAFNRLKKHKDKIIWIREFSEKAVDNIPECDFIYIDGNHEYSYVKKDINLYFKKVKKGGLLAGHDMELKGVFKAFSEFVIKNRLNGWVEYPDWIIQK